MVTQMLATGLASAFDQLVEKDTIVPVVAILMGCVIAIVGIIAGACRRASQTRARERTRSEVAAYIAEGSMTAEEGERLLKAGAKDPVGGCCGKRD